MHRWMAVGTIRHPDGVRPVELQRLNTQNFTTASTPPSVAVPFCTTLQRVKKVSFDENALKTDEFRSNHPSKISQTLNPPRLNYFPIKEGEFNPRELIRIAEAHARQRAQDLCREVYESGDEFDEPNEVNVSSPSCDAVLGEAYDDSLPPTPTLLSTPRSVVFPGFSRLLVVQMWRLP